MKTLLVALVAALALLVGLPAPAHADETAPAPFVEPQVVAPLYTTEVVVQAPRRSWGIRRAAREFDRSVPGVKIHAGRKDRCRDFPGATCVRVRIGKFTVARQHALALRPIEWTGLATYPTWNERVVYLNTRYIHLHPSRYAVAAHEFAHVLGLNHHDRPGVVGRTPDVEHLSPKEKRALRSYYRDAVFYG